mgnify:CR=1 FL=1
MKYKILVIDDNKLFVKSIQLALKEFDVIPAYSIEEGEEKLDDSIDLILLDLVFDEKAPDTLHGLELLPYIRNNYPDIQVIVVTNHTSRSKIIASIKSGAEDFLIKKDIDWTEWKNRLANYCRHSRKVRELKEKTLELQENQIIGQSAEMEFIKRKLQNLAQHSEDISILIQGETGVGKNLAVNYFRAYSCRKEKPYQEFSIVELSENLLESELFGHVKGSFTGAIGNKKGYFEAANGGILFLDEIGDYNERIQLKILRFIENKVITPVGSTKSKKLDVQLIMATNKNLVSAIEQGKFREDLYQRMNRAKIEIPSLRERREDIQLLTDHFVDHFIKKEKMPIKGISPEVHNILKEYHWPGNIRELQSVIWEACSNARLYGEKILTPKHIRKELTLIPKQPIQKKITNSVTNIKEKKIALELEEIEQALETTFGQKSKAAKLLGMNADQIRYRVLKAKDYILEKQDKFFNICKCYFNNYLTTE